MPIDPIADRPEVRAEKMQAPLLSHLRDFVTSAILPLAGRVQQSMLG